MSVDQRSIREGPESRRRERTDDAFKVVEPAQNPRVGPRLVPIVIVVLIGIGLLAAIFFWPR